MSCGHGACVAGLDTCIRRVPVFRNLSDGDIELLHGAIHSRSYRRGTFVFQEGEPSDALYVLHQGVIKISKLSEAGKEHVLRFLFPGDFLGQFALFQEGLHYANAQVLEDAVVCRVDRNDLKSILIRNPETTYSLLAVMSERLRDADEWAGSLSLLDAERRLAKTLLFFGGKAGESGLNKLPISKKDFAALIGIAPETLSRKLAHFESLRIIRLNGKKGIQILETNSLEEIAGNF